MVSGGDIPKVPPEAPLSDVMHVISSKRIGATCVIDSSNMLLGIITDGDLRRYLQSQKVIDITLVKAEELMTKEPKTITSDILAIDALHIMQDMGRKVMHLPVIAANGMVEGVIHIHDIVKAGIAEA
jgi:arabinose-5-phosphate isomerase